MSDNIRLCRVTRGESSNDDDVISDKQLALEWPFPLPRAQCGILLGNGVFGVTVWGDRKLCVSVNRADFWDHRNARPITEELSYDKLRRLWKAGELTDRYKEYPGQSGMIAQPSGLPMGRIELDIEPQKASLDMRQGVLNLTVAGRKEPIKLFMAMHKPVLLIEVQDNALDIAKKPSWDFLGKYFQSIGYEAPRLIDEPDLVGWIQMRPADPHMCLACGRIAGGLAVVSVYGHTAAEAREKAITLIGEVKARGLAAIKRDTGLWWSQYWSKTPRVVVPIPEDEELYYYGLFKLACMANDHAAPLVGPWAEEHKMPDCGNDYHFDINVQMTYWPAYAGNHLELLLPLFAKIKAWEPSMRRNAKCLFGVEDGLYLTMYASDTGEYYGRAWPWLTDMSSSAWVGQLMWLYYRYSLDEDFLRNVCYPFIKGVMRVCESVLEEENGQLAIPMSLSPEYNEHHNPRAAGKNPSFQLAGIHFLLESLITSAKLLGIDREKAVYWVELKKKVPPYATIEQSVQPYAGKTQSRRIAIYEGQDLEWSHRHHAHLGALHPFDTVDRNDQEFSRILAATIGHWIYRGVGEWIHFSFVWAAIIHARLNDGDAAYLRLDLFKRHFVNESRNSMVQAKAGGLTLWSGGDSEGALSEKDGDTGAVNAIQEMLIHTTRGVLHVFPAVPKAWKKEVSFAKMRAEGALLVSAAMRNGRIEWVEVESEKGGELRMTNNVGDVVVVERAGREREEMRGKQLVIGMKTGEIIRIGPAGVPRDGGAK